MIVLHAGAMGLKQGLSNVVESARMAKYAHPSVKFVFMGDGNQKTSLVNKAQGLANVSFIPPCAKTDLPNILAAADVLLINERASVADMSLPSKLTSYLVAGRPIVAAVPPDGYTAQEVRWTNAGIVVAAEQPNALLGAIARIAADPLMAEKLGQAGRRYVSESLQAGSILPQLREFVESVAHPNPR